MPHWGLVRCSTRYRVINRRSEKKLKVGFVNALAGTTSRKSCPNNLGAGSTPFSPSDNPESYALLKDQTTHLYRIYWLLILFTDYHEKSPIRRRNLHPQGPQRDKQKVSDGARTLLPKNWTIKKIGGYSMWLTDCLSCLQRKHLIIKTWTPLPRIFYPLIQHC